VLPAQQNPRSAVEKTRLIKAEAARLGFRLAGVTTPDPPPHLDVYANWLAAGRHGEMHYLAAERAMARRADPRTILPGCQSIVVLGAGYSPPGSPAEENQRFGQIAAYALGKDYHSVLEEKLIALATFCETLAEEPFACRWYSDTGPLLERELAQRAGLGWIGKNTCLINPQAGSYFLLSELLLTLPLEPDTALTTDHCGTCHRCIEACPTACILPNRTLDAQRCIAYLTIEQKGPIPLELRPMIGNWVFGCDICQTVCPWNVRFAQESAEPAFQPGPEMVSSGGKGLVDLVETLGLSPEDFNRRYRFSPVKRTKRRGLLRNTSVALGNLARGADDFAGRPALEAALQDTEPLVRGHAAWALGQAGGTLVALEAALQSETDDWVRAKIAQALARLRSTP
jgi:epoxyqueuosine reductase